MRKLRLAATVVVLACAPIATHAQDVAADACAGLSRLTLPDLASIAAENVPPGPFEVPAAGGPGGRTTRELPGFCRVRGVVTPAVRFEVWLPEPAAWNGRFEAVGGGGLAGNLSYAAMAGALERGYVTASTDTGHVAPDVEWLGDPQRLRDYGYRAIFEMTAKAKVVLARYYGRPADYNYFNGCSTGGRQGLMEAQRFPDDYDGIVTGAPVNYFVATHFTQLWTALAAKEASDDSILSAADLRLVNNAVLAQCDALDGLRDGVLENPLMCHFDPASLQCGVSGGGQCLTEDQVTAMRRIYAGPFDPRTGQSLHPGLAPGGEPTWSLVTSVGAASIPRDYFARSVFGDPNWDWRSFDYADDVELAQSRTGEMLDATQADLSRFRDAGHKLIVYHGWSDQVIFPQGTIEYYESVQATLADRPNPQGLATRDFFRLFMVPGMTHCRGGTGTDDFDMQSAIEAWVERGDAPDRIEARRVEEERVTRTRPLCPYPQTARYLGNGDPSAADSFVCRE